MFPWVPVVGDCVGRVVWTTEDTWVVVVRQYRGWRHGYGQDWRFVPGEEFFRLEVLARQLDAAGMELDAEFRYRRCVLTPRGMRVDLRADGKRIRQFMSKHYGVYGQARRPVRWGWQKHEHS